MHSEFLLGGGAGFELLHPPRLHCTLLGRPAGAWGSEIQSFIPSIYIVTISTSQMSKKKKVAPLKVGF